MSLSQWRKLPSYHVCNYAFGPRDVRLSMWTEYTGVTVYYYPRPDALSPSFTAFYHGSEFKTLVENCDDPLPVVDWLLEHAESPQQQTLATALAAQNTSVDSQAQF